MTERDIFIAALQKEDPAERQAYLDEACAGQADLQKQVQNLLRLHEGAGSFLEQPAAGSAATGASPSVSGHTLSLEHTGAVIGHYKLIEQIGEGGMGTVWMAQQTEPVKRLVAVKLIKVGMDSKQVIARFEAERQALVLMDHPNIARVLDGGTTQSEPGGVSPGRPYFVMDLVKGVPITKYCDEHRLTPRQRLELFLPVCQAIQHAHQKGIIHRDLKPSNVVVALYDGKPVPKVIDFGVAKATGQTLTDKTLVTGFGSIIGTLEYMSPEQAEINQLDIDTRSDIYSLGVLLYQLLTGSPPFTKKDLEKVGMLEMLRAIREQEPTKPSTKISTAEGLPTLAANRGMEPAKLSKLLRGELDWIVMKCLEKDRNRRYETANSFAMDLQRYLADEPVLACPPSLGYQLRKFVRRNKAGIVIAGMSLFSIVLLGGAVGWNLRVREERKTILHHQFSQELDELEKAVERDKLPEANAALRSAEMLLATSGGTEQMHERVRQWRADLDLLARLQEATLDIYDLDYLVGAFPRRLPSTPTYEASFRSYGIDCDSTSPASAAEWIRGRPHQVQLAMIAALDHWADVEPKYGKDPQKQAWLKGVIQLADTDSWRRRMRDAVERMNYETLMELAASPDLDKQAPYTLERLGLLLCEKAHKTTLGTRVLHRAIHLHADDFHLNFALCWRNDEAGVAESPRFRSVVVALQPDNPMARYTLGYSRGGAGAFTEAFDEFRKAIELKADFYPAYSKLISAAKTKDQLNQAVAACKKVIELKPDSAEGYYCLGEALEKQGSDEALIAYRESIRLDPQNDMAHLKLGNALWGKGFYEESIATLKEAVQVNPRNFQAQKKLANALLEKRSYQVAIDTYKEAVLLDPQNGAALTQLGDVLWSKGFYEKAITWYTEGVRLMPNSPYCLNELACGLEDCPDARLRDPKQAVELASRAVKLVPEGGTFWNTLGLAQYRAGDWKAAIAALKKSMELQRGRDESLDTFFLAMAHWRLREKTEARKWYNRAVAWMERFDPKNEQLRRFRAEAEELLGVNWLKNTEEKH
jgi:serine/threonine protein kinase/Flp pilus assembly protein TadD